MHCQRLTFFGDVHGSPLLADQLVSHQILQPFDLKTDGWLGPVEKVRRMGVAFDFDHRDEGSKKIGRKVYWGHAKHCNFKSKDCKNKLCK